MQKCPCPGTHDARLPLALLSAYVAPCWCTEEHLTLLHRTEPLTTWNGWNLNYTESIVLKITIYLNSERMRTKTLAVETRPNFSHFRSVAKNFGMRTRLHTVIRLQLTCWLTCLFVIPGYGVSPSENISQVKIPKLHTSLALEYLPKLRT